MTDTHIPPRLVAVAEKYLGDVPRTDEFPDDHERAAIAGWMDVGLQGFTDYDDARWLMMRSFSGTEASDTDIRECDSSGTMAAVFDHSGDPVVIETALATAEHAWRIDRDDEEASAERSSDEYDGRELSLRFARMALNREAYVDVVWALRVHHSH